MSRFLVVLLGISLSATILAQDRVEVQVDSGTKTGDFPPVWAWVGYDEPNYTYTKNGAKLLSQLADLSPVPVYVRAHCLLNSGDGTPALKWGSTNVYTEDTNGSPVYDWKILDRILDTYVERGMKPLFEIGFMPEDLTSSDMAYQHGWSLEPLKRDIHGSWAYPPKDYDKWEELVYRLVLHCIERYGAAEVGTWLWEPWNEANIGYWRGTQEEYHKLYDYTAHAVKRALPGAAFGGPHWAGILRDKDKQWLDAFLEHVLRGKNHRTGEVGSTLDFFAFHAKGSPKVVDDRVVMGLGPHMERVEYVFKTVSRHPELKDVPVIIGESDPEGCAACSSRVYPHNDYRNGTMYSSYTAAQLHWTNVLAERHGVNLRGIVTWAFQFDDQPYFDGFRALATNGIEKPVLNTFRMHGMMRGHEVAAKSSHEIGVDQLIRDGVRSGPMVAARSTRTEREISVLVYHYHDNEAPGADAVVDLAVRDMPAGANAVRVTHYRIDGRHSNSYSAWRKMRSPPAPTPEQYAALERAAGLEMLGSPKWADVEDGTVMLEFPLPRQGVSLVQLAW
jgi:xylan 1,4-beta-xylosidase